MKRRLQRGVEAVAPWRWAKLVPIHRTVAELIRKFDGIAGIAIVAKDRAPVAIELRCRSRHEIDRVARSVISGGPSQRNPCQGSPLHPVRLLKRGIENPPLDYDCLMTAR